MSDIAASSPSAARAAPAAPATGVRDLRLDFYRGLAMFIILLAHVPNNPWALWIPARFGFSDATEIFVFCSGMASAIAFGRVYAARGWIMGTTRVVFRVWQVYWAHIGTFLATVAVLVWVTDQGLTRVDYVGQLNLYPFLTDSDSWTAAGNLLGLMTLTYVPNYFDILPMYLVILAMMPVMVALARITPAAALGAMGAVWIAAQTGHLWMPAEPWSDREWFFNPFGWQLVFFTGFAFMAGWLPRPPVHRVLIIAALVIVLVSIPPAYFRITRAVAWAAELRALLEPFFGKTDFGALRYIHFLALAYLAWVAAGDGGERLVARGSSTLAAAWRVVLAAILKVGQQSLAVFVVSMVLAQIMGVAFDYVGRTAVNFWIGNLMGFGCLIGVAYGVGWIKAHPWRRTAGRA